MACGIAGTGTSGPPSAASASGQARISAIRSSQARPSGPGPSMKTGPMTCRLPAATAPRWAASWWKYMSSWVVQPPRRDSSAPSEAPSSTVAGSITAPSAAQTRVRKPWRSTSSARPRSRVIGRCVWRLTSPGITSRPRPSSTVSASTGPGEAGRSSVTTPSSTTTVVPVRTVSVPSTVTTYEASSMTTRLIRRPPRRWCRSRPWRRTRRRWPACGRARRGRRARHRGCGPARRRSRPS